MLEISLLLMYNEYILQIFCDKFTKKLRYNNFPPFPLNFYVVVLYYQNKKQEVKNMKFYLDSDNYESIKLEISEQERQNGMENILQEYCFAMASFFVDFSMKLDLNTEQAKSLQKACFSCIEILTNDMIEELILDDETDDVSEEQLTALANKMAEVGFSQEEINHVVEMVKESGSFESAQEYFKNIVREAGIDL